MAKQKDVADGDIDALGARVAERFCALPWANFNSHDKDTRLKTRDRVFRIRKDLMKVAAVDPVRASKIWDEHVPTFVPRPLELPERPRDDLPVNIIQAGRLRRPRPSEPLLSPQPSDPEGPVTQAWPESRLNEKVGSAPAKETVNVSQSREQADARARMLLEGLNKQYLQAEDKYHFRDKSAEIAFEAQERKLVTRHESPSVVASMIDLAEVRGWSSISLSGSEAFRREAWLQASLRDIDVTGYRPTKLDRVRRDELRSERLPGTAKNIIQQNDPLSGVPARRNSGFQTIADDGKAEPKVPLTPAQAQFLGVMEATMRHRGDTPETIARARDLANDRLTSHRVHLGKLVDVGTAPYREKKGEPASHFVTLEDEQGVRAKIWGVDLPRALNEARAEPGQLIAVAFKGRQPVSVDVQVRDAGGAQIGTEQRLVNRNSWEIVQFDRLRAEARSAILKAVQRQENPAQLQVFDRKAPPVAPPPPPGRTSRTRLKEPVR